MSMSKEVSTKEEWKILSAFQGNDKFVFFPNPYGAGYYSASDDALRSKGLIDIDSCQTPIEHGVSDPRIAIHVPSEESGWISIAVSPYKQTTQKSLQFVIAEYKNFFLS